MPRSAYDFSIRESLQNNRKLGLSFAVILLLCAAGISSYYLWPRSQRVDPTVDYYSDDDGQTYFKDSIYKFPPFDHDGKIADEAVISESNGHRFVALLMRFTPEARKKLQDKYDESVKNNLPVQQPVLDLMSTPPINMQGMEVKVPGSDNQWMPRMEYRGDVKPPDGNSSDRHATP